MTANELADKLKIYWHYENSNLFEEAATMLRQQQAEIEALKSDTIPYKDLHQVVKNVLAHPMRELTDEEIWKLWQTHLNDDITVFARFILKKASEK